MSVRTFRTLLLVGVLALLAGCTGPWPQSALHPESDVAANLDRLFQNIFWWAVLVFVVVETLLLYVILRYRDRPDRPHPTQVHGHTTLEIGWTLAPAVILVFIAIPTVRTIFEVDGPPRDDAMVVEVIGKRWWWEFRYPEEGIVTANEATIPVGRTVDWRLRTEDVLHSFWVPRLGGKRDLVSGRENRLWFTPDSTGTYMGQCAEFCGIAHALMGLRVHVVEPDAFEAWVESQRAPAESPEDPLAARGEEYFLNSACIGCHRVRGTHAAGTVGPDLTNMGSRRTIAGGTLGNTPENMARWLRDPQGVKPGNLMPDLGLTDEQIDMLVAYLESLR